MSTEAVERWSPTLGYEPLYEVSSLGSVRRIAKGGGARVGRILKPWTHKLGYQFYTLSKGGISKGMRAHRLVWESFHGKVPVGKEINHLDGNKLNNALTNLEAVSRSENRRHALAMGLTAAPVGERNGKSKLTDARVATIRELFKSGVSRRELSERFKTPRRTIHGICSNQRRASLTEAHNKLSLEITNVESHGQASQTEKVFA